MSDAYVIKVAVLATADMRPKELSRLLDRTFEDQNEILQLVVQGHGWGDDADSTEASIWAALVDDTAEKLADEEGE
jgi:hypothetical protein